MFQIIEELRKLRLDLLGDDWVQGIFYSEFLEFGEFPLLYENILENLDIPEVFKAIMNSIKEWLSAEDDGEDKSWAILSHHVDHQKLLAILAYFIDYGTKNVTTREYRNNALLASRTYYSLLSIPGYKAYHIYHSQLFAHSLACLGFPKVMCDKENSYNNVRDLTREVNSVIKELSDFVRDLKAIIESLQLNPTDINFEDILSNLVDITGGSIVNKLNVDKIELGSISTIIYDIIHILICDLNGEPNAVAIRLLFKCVLPKLLAASVDTRNANNIVRASYVTYSGLLLNTFGKAALPGYTVLLQHICHNQDGIERAEVRQARVPLVVGMMSFLPRKSFRNFLNWLLKLSTSPKISQRQISLEILAKLLANEAEVIQPRQSPAPAAGTSENAATEDGKERPSDENIKTQEAGKECDNEAETNTERPNTAQPANDDDSSQDSQLFPLRMENADHEMTEEELAGLLRQRCHTVPHTRILHAVYERAHDVSSTLRARALNILADCLCSDREPLKAAIQDLNGKTMVSQLMALAAGLVCDERAVVRRAALLLVQRSVLARDAAAPPDTPTIDLEVLVGLCRDASILVRSAAITAIGELVLKRPTVEMFDAFLSGPMNQLTDPEAKVQEQVLSLIQHLCIERLSTYSGGAGEDPLPWMFLAAVTRHNKRKHLQKACAMFVKTPNRIGLRLIDTLSTHLGAADDERDLQCLVMLTSAARYIDYNDIGFALDYYYRLATNDQERDLRLMPLVLELLSTWTRWMRASERATLRDNLVERVASGCDDGCRLWCSSLAQQLDPENLSWSSELMQISEKRVLEGSDVDEWVRASDLSLVAPLPPSPRLMRLYIDSVTRPPPEWDAVTLGSAVAGCGRLCVRSRDVAVHAAPPLAALLQDNAAPLAPRINALLTLTDICTRYTCIVEPLMGCISGCLSVNADGILRRTATRALTRLLLAGYLRLRTPLYYRFCALLADEDHDVREPAEYFVTCCLTPESIYHHFVDCVLHYNKDDHDALNISFDARQLIYDVMLQRLSIVQRLNLQCRLAREVLEHAADLTDEGDGELPPAINAALLDTITLLCGPRMKLPRKPQRDGAEPGDLDDLQERVTTNIVSHKMKRTVAEVLVPAVLRLYARLRTRGGQVPVYLVRIATDLLNDYRQEIEELIDNDEELVDRVRQFQETIGLEPSFGNTRNLVTTSTTHEPETPRAPRRRAPRAARSPPRKRPLKI